MRAIYETKENRQREQAVADEIQKKLIDGATISPSLPYSYKIDRVLMRNEGIIAWLEIKCRERLYYRTLEFYEISLRKIKDGVLWAGMTDSAFLLAVRFNEGIMLTRIDKERLAKYPVIWGGWANPRYDADKELMLCIPVSEFGSLNYFKPELLF